MSSLFPYPDYRSSGTDWIGEVPATWDVVATARVSDLTTGERDTQDAIEEGAYPFFVRSQTVERINTYSFDGEGVLTSGDGAGVGKIFHHATGKFEIHQRVYLFFNFRRIIGKYFFYFLREHLHLVALAGNAKSTVDSLRRPMLRMFPICVPNLEEQTQIARFLDYETAKIDALIEKQEQLIALLKEKRQAVISHAVTKGLDPSAPLRDSGIEWLGQVPAHWKVAKSGFYLRILSGYAFPSSGFASDDTGVRLLRGINVGVGVVRWEDTVRWKRRPGDGLDQWDLTEGDLVVGMDRPMITEGVRVAKLRREDVPSLLLQRVASLKPRPTLNGDYMMQLLSFTKLFEAHFAPETTGVSVPHISPKQIADFSIPIPPRREQDAIVAWVKERLEKTDRLVSSAEAAAALLAERRTALISAAVTGKIDVRGWKPPEGSEDRSASERAEEVA